MTRMPLLSCLFLACSLMIHRVEGRPFMLFEHTGTKCFAVESRSGYPLIIKYHVPDLVLISEDDSQETDEGRPVERNPMGAYDERYERHMDSKRAKVAQRNQNMKDLNIVISTRSSTKNYLLDPVERNKPSNKPKHMRVNLEQKEGEIEFDTDGYSGSVDICVRSLHASKRKPSRVGISVKNNSDVYTDSDARKKIQADRALAKLQEKVTVIQKEKSLFDTKMSRMESEMLKIEKTIRMAERESKACWFEYEKFFENGSKMQEGMNFWPMVRIMITLIGGIMQVVAVIKFFEKKNVF